MEDDCIKWFFLNNFLFRPFGVLTSSSSRETIKEPKPKPTLLRYVYETLLREIDISVKHTVLTSITTFQRACVVLCEAGSNNVSTCKKVAKAMPITHSASSLSLLSYTTS